MSSTIGASLGSTFTTTTIEHGKGFAVGDKYEDHQGNTYVFVQASSAITRYDVCLVKEDYEAVPLSATNVKTAGFIGIADGTALALDEYGWLMTHGRPRITVLVDAAADVPLYATATAGALDDATTSHAIRGLVLTDSMTTTTSGNQEAVASFPQVEWGATLSQI